MTQFKDINLRHCDSTYISKVSSDIIASYHSSTGGHGKVTSEDIKGGGLPGSCGELLDNL